MADYTLVAQYGEHLHTVDSINVSQSTPDLLYGDTYTKAPSSIGLVQLNDTSPLSVTLTTDSDLTNSDYYTHAVAGVWSEYDSYGVDLGSARTVGKIRIYIDPGAETFTGWFQSSAPPGTSINNYFQVYSSSDNSNWTLRLNAEANSADTIVSASSGQACLDIELSSPVNARYWKIRGYSLTAVWILSGFHWVLNSTTYGDLYTAQGHNVYIGEVEAWEYVITGEHIHTADNVALTQKHVLTVQGADHLQVPDDADGMSGTFYPAANSDDGFWNLSSGTFYGTSNWLVIGNNNPAAGVFIRFPNVTIPAGATIASAYVKFTSYSTNSTTPVLSNVYFNDEDDAVAPTNGTQANALALTTGVAWDAIEPWTNDNQNDKPSLVSALKEVIDRAGWASGQAVMAVIRDDGSALSTTRLASAYEYNSHAEIAELHVQYDTLSINLHLAPQSADQLHTVDAVGTFKVAAVDATETLYPATQNDDGTDTNNTLTLDAASLIMGHYGGYSSSIFIRFDGVNIERLQQVQNAYVRFTAYGSTSGTTCKLRIYAVDDDDADAPTNDTEWDALTQTTAYVDWTLAAWTDDTTYDSPNIASVIQEVVNRAGWTGLSAIVIQLLDNSSDSGAYRRASSYDYNSGAQKPELHLEWISAGRWHTQTVDGALVLVEHKDLVVAETYHAHAVDNISAMFVGINLTGASCDHLHTVESVTIVVDLVVASCDHLHTVDDINQTLASVGIQAADHVHAVDGLLLLTQKHVLTVQGADHLHTSEAQIGVHIPAVAGCDHIHTVDGITGTLIWVHPDHDEPYHIQAVESPALTQDHTLAVQGSDQLQAVDNVGILHLVISQEAYHEMVADSIALTQQHTLVVQEAYHLHVPDYGIKIQWALRVDEEIQIWESIDLGWILTLAESLDISEEVTEQLGWKIKESLVASETVLNQWSGVLTVEETLKAFGTLAICEIFNETAAEALTITDTASFVHRMISSIAESLGISEVVTPSMTYNPLITEALGVAAALTAIRTTYLTNAESLEATDTLSWQWNETVAESIKATDTATLAFYAVLALTESLKVTETVLNTLQVDETLAEALEIVASLTAQQKFNLSIEESIIASIKVLLDDEVWECWVLNGNQFAPSVYSGFDFNSYTVFGNAAYGCREDGIYELTGATDQGTAITAGIVLPETYFGVQRVKRFRKAYFGLSGTSPSIRMETDSGSKTYTISDSKANLTRDLYGRQWTLKLQGFTDVQFIELWPVVLTR